MCSTGLVMIKYDKGSIGLGDLSGWSFAINYNDIRRGGGLDAIASTISTACDGAKV